MGHKNNLLFAESDCKLSTSLMASLSRWGYRVDTVTSADALRSRLATQPPNLLMLDERFQNDGLAACSESLAMLPSLPVVIYANEGCIKTAVAAIKQGACDYVTLPLDMNRLQAILKKATLRGAEIQNGNSTSKQAGNGAASVRRPMIGHCSAMREVMDKLREVAQTDATVLLLGESGTGKELIARELHHLSQRQGQFVPVNLAALAPTLAESGLFGHEKGSFTGAERLQRGWCEVADRGTLFLDEIGEMELSLQPKLLRFLQEQTIDRVGSGQSIHVDVRVVAATNRNLHQMLHTGELRKDLYYRLNIFPIELPPLRNRREDIPELANWFLRCKSERVGKPIASFTPEALQILMDYDWPGNIRQLENTIHRTVILCRHGEISADLLPPELGGSDPVPMASIDAWQPSFAAVPAGRSLAGGNSLTRSAVMLSRIEQIEKQAIQAALDRCDGHVVRAAELLGFGHATLYRKIKIYNISK